MNYLLNPKNNQQIKAAKPKSKLKMVKFKNFLQQLVTDNSSSKILTKLILFALKYK